MEQVTLKATQRDLLGKKVKLLRTNGEIPAVVYGRGFKNITLSLNSKEFNKIAETAGEATLINLEIPENKPLKVLIRNIQKNPVYDNIIHVDLYKVDMSEELQTEIPLVFEGVAPAVEDLEGNFISNKDTIRVECLPDKLVPELKVDISVLKTFDDFIHVKDIIIPEGIKVLDDGEEVIAQVTAPTSEEELQAMEEEAAAGTEKAQIESIEAEAAAEKAEGEEGTEAEASTAQEPKNDKKE